MCGWEWRDLPTAQPIPGVQPADHDCPNRKCPKRHWIIAYKLILGVATRLQVVDVVPSLGRDAGSYRASLQQIEEMDPDSIELYVYVRSITPEDRRAR